MTTFISYGKVAKLLDGNLFLEGSLIGSFKSMKEAKEYLHGLKLSDDIKEDVKDADIEVSTDRIALALYESGVEKVTETLVSGFKEIIDRRLFYPSDVVVKLREQYDCHEVYGKIEYDMMDGSSVMIDIETNFKLNKLINMKESKDLLLYMTKSSSNFLDVIQKVQEEL